MQVFEDNQKTEILLYIYQKIILPLHPHAVL